MACGNGFGATRDTSKSDGGVEPGGKQWHAVKDPSLQICAVDVARCGDKHYADPMNSAAVEQIWMSAQRSMDSFGLSSRVACSL